MHILLLVSAALYSLTVVRTFWACGYVCSISWFILTSHPKDTESCWFYFAVAHSLQVMSWVGSICLKGLVACVCDHSTADCSTFR